jgi:hypothetical protein
MQRIWHADACGNPVGARVGAEVRERFSCMIITTCWILWMPSIGAASTPLASVSERAAAARAAVAALARAVNARARLIISCT